MRQTKIVWLIGQRDFAFFFSFHIDVYDARMMRQDLADCVAPMEDEMFENRVCVRLINA